VDNSFVKAYLTTQLLLVFHVGISLMIPIYIICGLALIHQIASRIQTMMITQLLVLVGTTRIQTVESRSRRGNKN